RAAGKLVPIASSLRGRGGVHPGQVASPSQGNTETHRTDSHAHWTFSVQGNSVMCCLSSNPHSVRLEVREPGGANYMAAPLLSVYKVAYHCLCVNVCMNVCNCGNRFGVLELESAGHFPSTIYFANCSY
ncbi:hypothetical protein ATANTOWER_008457, partial [Ataeniobius toweri]|nr:hypothetical protein [Ataeniobius toweri]